ncbi:MAG TPA: prolyl oligopeptidase family serine peptidase [Anaerolineae bacterium]
MSNDRQIQEAFHHWMPRFMASTVDYSDLQRMITKMESWDDWCRVWSEMGAEHEALAEEALAKGHRVTATDAYLRATIYYHFGNAIFYQDMAQKEAAHWKKVECYTKAAPYLDPPAERLEIPFDDTTLPAYLRLPPGPGPHPCVILVCGSDSVKEQETEWENTLLKRGMATLSFDGPGQGEMWFRMKMRLDYETCFVPLVDYLVSRDDIDSERIGLLGHSKGGYLGARGAGYEHRLKCAVLIAPFFDRKPFDKLSTFLRAGYKHISGSANEDEAREFVEQFTLSDIAGDIQCPILIIHGGKDTLTPLDHAERLVAATNCPTELLVFPDGNHVVTNYVYKMRPAAADWLADRLVTNS